jgi:PPOX class probable F420-dependent enzyme
MVRVGRWAPRYARRADDHPQASEPVTSDASDLRRWLLDEAPNVIVATIGQSGVPQLTPNWFLWDGEVFWVSTVSETVKVRNLRRDSRITLCIDRTEPPEAYVQVFGRADIVETDVRVGTLPLIAKYVSPQSAVEAHWTRLAGDRVLLRIVPDRWQWFGVDAA